MTHMYMYIYICSDVRMEEGDLKFSGTERPRVDEIKLVGRGRIGPLSCSLRRSHHQVRINSCGAIRPRYTNIYYSYNIIKINIKNKKQG